MFLDLDGRADLVIADQAHLAEDLALAEGRDGDAGVVEDTDAAGDDDVKIATRFILADDDIVFLVSAELEELDDDIEIFVVDILEEGKKVKN